MSRLAACPKCRNQFSLPALTGPATIACPFCGAHITIKMKQTAPPPAMVVQPAMAVAQAMPAEDEYEDEEEEEERPRKKKNKNKKGKKKKSVLAEETPADENWLKASILIGILLITVVSVVLVFVIPIWQHRSQPNIIKPSGTAAQRPSGP
ncbi:MAG: hypothetical protein QM703_03475 [Gemmatales bacterium]